MKKKEVNSNNKLQNPRLILIFSAFTHSYTHDIGGTFVDCLLVVGCCRTTKPNEEINK